MIAAPPRHLRRRAAALVLIAVLAVGFTIYYVSGEDGIYLWDYHGYWDRYKELGAALYHINVPEITRSVGTIVKSDYNASPVIPLQPFSLLFPGSRTGYILAVVLLYLLPTAAVSAKFGTLAGGVDNSKDREIAFIVLLALAALYPPYWVPSLRGYPDISGLIPLGLATILVFRGDFGSRISVQGAVALGVLLWAPFLLRRWYAYAIVAFFASASAYSLAAGAMNKKEFWERAGRITATYGIAGAVAALCAVAFQPLLILNILRTDYSDIYQYNQVSGHEHIESLLNVFGPIPLTTALLGLVVGLKNKATRLSTLFVITNALLLYFLFTRTQAFGPHHYLPLAFWIFGLMAIGVCAVLQRLRGPVAIAVAALVLMAVFWGSFFPLPSWAREVAWLAPLSKNYQLKLSNRHDYDALLADAERLVAQGHKLTVFGFGYDGDDDIISDELFEALEGERSKDWLVRTAHVDRRDRFKIEPLLAHYAIVPDSSLSATLEHPALPPWPPTSQRAAHAHFEQVVVAPAELIRGHRGIGAAYRRLPKEYTISPGVTVHIYEKVRPFTIEEADELLAQFYRLYPEWRGDYAFAEAVLVSSLGSGDREAKVEVELPNNLQIWPDKAVSEQMVIPTEALVRTSARGLVVSVQHKWGRCSDQKDIPVKLDARSGPIWTGNVSAQEQIIHFLGNEGIISLTIGPSQQGCEYLSIHPFLSGP